MDKKSFHTDARGFHITFPNGVRLSTQFAAGNYCENYNSREWEATDNSSNDCEIAIIGADGVWLTDIILQCGDDIKGYIPIEEWLSVVDKCKNYLPNTPQHNTNIIGD